MRKGTLWISLITGILLCAICLAGIKEAEGEGKLYAEVSGTGGSQRIACWQDWDGTAYFFLPAYTQMDQVRLISEKRGAYRVEGTAVEEDFSCAGMQFRTPYVLEAEAGASLTAERLVFVCSANVDTVYIDLRSGSAEYLHEDKNHKESGSLRIYDPKGTLTYTGYAESVSGRGQSTWDEEKKAYNVTLQNPADLLGMGSAENWILLANSKDATNLRNKMVLDFAAKAGLAFTPDSRWVDLYLNGEYAGLYLLCERNEVHPQRVNIAREGSFLVSKDWEWRFDAEGKTYVQTESGTALGIRYADMSTEELLAVWQSVENAIFAEDGVDPVTGKELPALMDIPSWVSKYLLEEIFANHDGATLSQYYYRDGGQPDGRICAGPAWDYDLILSGDPESFFALKPGTYGSHWPWALYSNAQFRSRIMQEYASRFRPLTVSLLEQDLDAYLDVIREASRMNEIRWGYGWEDSVEDLRLFLKQRIAFLDKMWADDTFCLVYAIGLNGDIRQYICAVGAAMPELPVYEATEDLLIYGWTDLYSGEEVDPEGTVTGDMAIYLSHEYILPEGWEEPVSEEPPAEPQSEIGLLRIMPALAFLGIFAVLLLTEGIRMLLQSRGKKKHRRIPQ